MTAIRIKKQLDSETLHLPELKPLLGKQVEIIVLEESSTESSPPQFDFDKQFGSGWPDDVNDGFEEAVRKWRREDRPRELPE